MSIGELSMREWNEQRFSQEADLRRTLDERCGFSDWDLDLAELLTVQDYLEMADEAEQRAKEYGIEPPLDLGDNPEWLHPTLRACHKDNLRIRKIRAKECRETADEFRRKAKELENANSQHV